MSSLHRRRNLLVVATSLLILILSILLIRGVILNRREAARDRIEAELENARQSGSKASPAANTGDAAGGGSQNIPGQSGNSQQDSEQDGQLAPPQSPPEPEGGIVPVEDSADGIEIIDQAVTSYRGPPGGQRAFQASVKGRAGQVIMSISGPGGAFSVALMSGPFNAEHTNWSTEAAGPSMPGTYSYSTTAIADNGQSVSAQGATFIVDEQ